MKKERLPKKNIQKRNRRKQKKIMDDRNERNIKNYRITRMLGKPIHRRNRREME